MGIPVIGNGDIRSGADALSMVSQTNCDAVMIARAAQGNPWIFAEVNAALAGSDFKAPSAHERIEMARRHARLLAQRHGRNIVRMRKHACWYVAGMPGASKARVLFNASESLEQFEHAFDYLEDRLASTEEEGWS